MRSVSASEMRELDRQATEVHAIPSLQLMENAGRGVAELIVRRYHLPSENKGGGTFCVLVVCGKGNNAGDGFVVARLLYNKKVPVRVLLLAPECELKGDAKTNYERLPASLRAERSNLLLKQIASSPSAPRNDGEIIIDAIFGIGIKSEVTGIYKEAIEAINGSKKPVIAIDIPSGLDADTGEVHGVAVKATMTATMGFAKHGLMKNKGPLYSGEVVVIDIGLPTIDTP